MSVVFGSILYRIIIAIVLQLGMKSTDLKLLTAVIVALALALPVINAKRTRHQKRKINRLQKKSETNKKASIQ
jgi:putative ABC transport system permease protein